MSSIPFRRHSGMVCTRVQPAADGSTKVFSKVTDVDQVGNLASDGAVCRVIRNLDAALTMYFGETEAAANDADLSWELPPGGSFVLLGPSGVGWAGDVYVKGDATAYLNTMEF